MRTSWWTLVVMLTAVGCGSAGGGVGSVGGASGAGGVGNAPGGGGVGNAPGGGGVGNAPGGGGVGNAPGGGGVGNAPGGGGVGNAPGGGGVGNAPGGGGVGNAPGGGGVGNAPGGGGTGNAPGGGGTGGGTPSCNGYCGSANPVPGGNCYCDTACKQYNDCCADYTTVCGGGTGGAGGTGGGGTGGTGATGGAGGGTSTVLDLRADVNRDGNVDTSGTSDETGEETWDQSHGAIFLANIDDDDKSCPTSGTDSQLAACNDATNTTIDGSGDLTDLARLKTVPWPTAPSNAAATIGISPSVAVNRVRLFKNVGGAFTAIPNGASITASELQSGVEFAIEGTDVRRDTSWDGYLNVTLTLTAGGSGSDTVKMRMSPVMLSSHVQDATSIYVTPFSSTDSQAFRTDMQAACNGSGSTYTELPAGLGDQWTQDYFETGYMAMPAAGGQQKIIRVYFRSANYTGSLRVGGKVVYTYFRGPDRAGVTQYDPNHPDDADTLNSFGNTETIPPYSYNGKSYPLGRIMRGSVSNFYPDQAFETLLTAQGMQPQVFIDTSWLAVAHVDETISFAKASNPRGWIMLVNDAALAKKMLQDAQNQGYGNASMFVGKTWSNNASAQVTVNQVLGDFAIMGASNEAVAEVNSQVATLKAETGITDAEIVKLPFLHWKSGGYSVAYQPGTVNYTYVGPKTIAAPKPFGPVIGGVDIFEKQMKDALAPYGISVKFVENWNLYHRLLGEVHCGSNADRAVTTKWWETGK